MFIIALEDVEFFSYHGFYPEEHILGNKYLLSVYVEIDEKQFVNEKIDSTLNYEKLFFILKNVMNRKYQLLETVAQEIHAEILLISGNIHSIDIKIQKLNPMIDGMKGKSVVQLKKNYNA